MAHGVAAAQRLGAEARRVVLARLPATGVEQPAIGGAALAHPPIEVPRQVGVDLEQPDVVGVQRVEPFQHQEGVAPGWRGAADRAVGGDHVVGAILARAGHVGQGRVAEGAQQQPLRQARVGVGQQQRVDRRLGQHHARRLDLHGVPDMPVDAERLADHHAQRLEVVDQAAPPVIGPVASQARGACPERVVLGELVAASEFGAAAGVNQVAPGFVGGAPARKDQLDRFAYAGGEAKHGVQRHALAHAPQCGHKAIGRQARAGRGGPGGGQGGIGR